MLLNSALSSGYVEVVKMLLEKGADIITANNYRVIPLNAASSGSHVEVVKILLEKGANVIIANNNG
ncbi:uncharacterized protein BKA55DRAFT_530783 [Fusarium redolens]|uniref:Ankyrin repeat protein n=1 Tax=Fusarium redolens TaxID=48865 RepID=A0A9P9FXR9_FUSRE|nr:uncharacterized protein BKA55DRAFT_530783 [Fusarium redolens]KAH7205171.1 hypothetical protein BKA55DRAFT_530783 [Fusarium redolens]